MRRSPRRHQNRYECVRELPTRSIEIEPTVYECGVSHQQPDQPAVKGIGLPGGPRGPGRGVGGAAGEDGDDGVLRDGQQPPLDQDQAAGEPLRVGDVQRGGGTDRENHVGALQLSEAGGVNL